MIMMMIIIKIQIAWGKMVKDIDHKRVLLQHETELENSEASPMFSRSQNRVSSGPLFFPLHHGMSPSHFKTSFN